MGYRYQSWLKEFEEHLLVKAYSPKTITSCCQHLNQFFVYLKAREVLDVTRLGKADLKAYQEHLAAWRGPKGQGYTGNTQGRKLTSLRRFFEHLEGTNRILINPMEFIHAPKLGDRLPKVILTPEEARRILDVPNLSWKAGLRDRAILEVLYSTGVRLGELAALSIHDADLQGGYLRVNSGKGAKDRVIPLGRHAVRFLKEYLDHVRPAYLKRSKTQGKETLRALWLNQCGEPLSYQVLGILVRRCARAAKVGKKVTPHTFRHTFATQLLRQGADVTAVQRMLGHADLSVTHKYTRVAGVEVSQTHRLTHPRERDKEAVEAGLDLVAIRERHA